MPFAATWIDLEIIILSEASQLEKDNYHLISFYKWSLKYTNELIYKIEKNSQTLKQTIGIKGDGGGGR